MSEQQDNRRGLGITWWLAIVFCVMFLYVLSLGPLVWLITQMGQPGPGFESTITGRVVLVYVAPIQFAYEALGEPWWMDAYFEMWYP